MKRWQRAFTLLEVLVALAVLATAMGAVIQAAGDYTANQAHLRDRTFAEWVARNQLAAVQLSDRWPEVGQEKGDAELPAPGVETEGREWRWEMQVIQTAEEDLRRLDIEVFPRDAEDKAPPLARLSGFMVRPR
jgi:general secretion pathway protein I